MKIIIIGGVAGGATAAARLRRLNEGAEIIIFERSGFVSYANCGLPYYIGGEIIDKEELTLQNPESFWRRFKIDVRTYHEVIKINPYVKTVSVYDIKSHKTFEENYDKLILAPGANPVKPNFSAMNSDKVFTLRTVEDAFRIREFIDYNNPKTAVVIGGGFIGLEMAENLKKRGIDVTIIQKNNQLLNVIDSDMTSFIHSKFRNEGIKLLLGLNVNDIKINEKQVSISADCINYINADMVIVSIGVVPENTLAKDAGLSLGIKGAIKVNEKMQTSDENIYAVGDAVEVKHYITNEKTVIALAGPANKQARIAADNICGINSKYNGSQGSSVIKVFDMTVASTGINEIQAKNANINYEKVILSPLSHAAYYPGAKVMTLKVLYEKETLKILGAQCIGYKGVDKRIDVLATAIYAGLTADKLKDLDLSYAPPYSSAKDPVNMAGFIIDNIEKGIVKQFYYEDLLELQNRSDVTLLDTRTEYEFIRGHCEGFINIPLDSLRERISEIDKSKPVYIMCQSGLRSYLATRILMQNGFDSYNFVGGYSLYNSIHNEQLLASNVFACGMEK